MNETKANSDSIFILQKQTTYNENTYNTITKKPRQQDGDRQGQSNTMQPNTAT